MGLGGVTHSPMKRDFPVLKVNPEIRRKMPAGSLFRPDWRGACSAKVRMMCWRCGRCVCVSVGGLCTIVRITRLQIRSEWVLQKEEVTSAPSCNIKLTDDLCSWSTSAPEDRNKFIWFHINTQTHSLHKPTRWFPPLCILQDEVNQIMETNLWLRHVSTHKHGCKTASRGIRVLWS